MSASDSRQQKSGQAAPRHFGNWLAASLMRGLYRVQVTDLGL